MCAKLNKEQMESLRYREDRLEQLQQRLEQYISGSEASLLPLVRTKRGGHSEAGTQRLVEELTDALDRIGPYRLKVQEKEFFRAFLYCAIRVSADCAAWEGTRGCFSDILRLSENIFPQSAVELHHLELDDLYFNEDFFCFKYGFFGSMSGLYRLFTGHDVSDTLTAEEIAAVRERWPDDDRFSYDEDPDPFADMTDEELAEQAELAEQVPDLEEDDCDGSDWADQALKEYEAMSAAFAKKEEFCRQYLICRRLYFPVTETAETPLPVRLRRMLDLYLVEHGCSFYLDDDRFFGVYTELKKTLSRLQAPRKPED